MNIETVPDHFGPTRSRARHAWNRPGLWLTCLGLATVALASTILHRAGTLHRGLPVKVPAMEAWRPTSPANPPPFSTPQRHTPTPPRQSAANLRRSGIEIIAAMLAQDAVLGHEPDADLYEDPFEVVLLCDMPGARASDIGVRFDHGVLTLYGEVVQPRIRKLLAQQFSSADYYRVFAIDSAIDVDRISAEAADGVLIVRLPKAAKIQPHRIAVRAA